MFKKIGFILFALVLSKIIVAQTIPIKLFSLKKDQSILPSDSLGTAYFYSVTFEVNDTLILKSANLKLKNTKNDSIISQQLFNLPIIDSVYQTGLFQNGLIKDHNSFFILLGNFKSKEPLTVTADFIDSKNIYYKDILTNE